MKVEKGRRVRLKVHLTAVGGDEIEKSVVEYVQGSGTMLPGLEKVVEGLGAGEQRKGVIKAENAFGDASFQREKTMKRKEFPEDMKVEPGERFMAKGADNQQDVVLEIARIEGDTVHVKLLHPLADKDISYELEVMHVGPTPPPLPPEALGAEDE
ncbi:FKBP-type peptidyl-prolyl cis-trans isomerase [Haliangium sp.]|uniref:FKBP-type peptidyl-prolyl cis-trans isomerase n=1 Tax=Haliangium sp. TaxID=2663208 RepID=UPI003D0B0682